MPTVTPPQRETPPDTDAWGQLESTEEVRRWLTLLRNPRGRQHDEPALASILDRLSAALERLVAEHEGLSTEVLGAYEQLGVVSEVTRQLPTVHTEAAVVNLFAASLRRSFAQAKVSVARPQGDGFVLTDGAGGQARGDNCRGATHHRWLEDRITAARSAARILVEARPGNGRSKQAGGNNQGGECMIGPVFAGDEFVGAIILSQAPGAQPFRAGEMRLVEALTTFCGDLIRNHRLTHELREMSLVMVRALVNAVDQKDEYTSGHSIRVGFFATMLGQKYGISAFDLQMLQWSALLHDIGKIGIRDDVLKKAGRLSDDEFQHIQEHPVRSHKVVQQIPHLADALDGILHHHEHYDGGGYPHGLKGEEIPLQARIIQIADVFDALTSTRSYRPAHDWRKALDILEKEAGKTVDPNLRLLFDQWIRDELGDDPNGWERLLARANRFDQDGDGLLRIVDHELQDRGAASRVRDSFGGDRGGGRSGLIPHDRRYVKGQ